VRPSAAQALVRRVRIVLLAHAGWPNARISAALGCAVNTVREWRGRFVTVLAAPECDTDLVSYEMAMLVEAVGDVLTPASRTPRGT
jgi:DNA-binding NarL/FixJ family response regulator